MFLVIFKMKKSTNNVVCIYIFALTILIIIKLLIINYLTTNVLTKVHRTLTNVHQIKIGLIIRFYWYLCLGIRNRRLYYSYNSTRFSLKSTTNPYKSTPIGGAILTKVQITIKVYLAFNLSFSLLLFLKERPLHTYKGIPILFTLLILSLI